MRHTSIAIRHLNASPIRVIAPAFAPRLLNVLVVPAFLEPTDLISIPFSLPIIYPV